MRVPGILNLIAHLLLCAVAVEHTIKIVLLPRFLDDDALVGIGDLGGILDDRSALPLGKPLIFPLRRWSGAGMQGVLYHPQTFIAALQPKTQIYRANSYQPKCAHFHPQTPNKGRGGKENGEKGEGQIPLPETTSKYLTEL